MNTITLKPIGLIHTPFKRATGTPIQPSRSAGARGRAEVFPEFAAGLVDLDGFSHVILVYYFHLCRGYDLRVVPYLDTRHRGLFATRAPRRPNPIGLSVVRLEKIENATLYVADVDIIDGAPLLDIKPYFPEFDYLPDCKTGWLRDSARDTGTDTADERFHE